MLIESRRVMYNFDNWHFGLLQHSNVIIYGFEVYPTVFFRTSIL